MCKVPIHLWIHSQFVHFHNYHYHGFFSGDDFNFYLIILKLKILKIMARPANTVNDTVALYKMLKAEWDRPNHNLEKCETFLSKLKIYLTKLAFLPIQSPDESSKMELIVARDILEIGALHSIESKDNHAFERYLAQLKCYYFDYSSDLPESVYKYQLLGLNLLCLLSQNRVSEFHTVSLEFYLSFSY